MAVSSVPVAALYALRSARHLYFYIGGFNPAFARFSPGSLLLRHVIRDAISEGANELHFLRGKEDYKYRWNATDRQLRRVVTEPQRS